MNGMLGMTQLLMGTDLDDKQYRFAQTVKRSAESLLDIINDVLDFSKIEAGRLELEGADARPGHHPRMDHPPVHPWIAGPAGVGGTTNSQHP